MKAARTAVLALCLVAPLTVSAEEPAPAGAAGLSVELNALQPSERGCRVTFVVANGLKHDIARAAYELAFFDAEGLISRLAVVDFLGLDSGRTRVRQFEFAGLECEGIGRILINDLAECSGEDVPATICLDRLAIDNKTSIQFGT